MSSEREQRLQQIRNLQEQSDTVFQHYFDREQTVSELIQEYEGEDEDEISDIEVRTAGRVMEIRDFGSLAFIDLRGERDQIQLVTQDEEAIEHVQDLHNGDIIGVNGSLTYTDRGEFSVRIENIEVLTRGARPIPSDYFGVENPETRYRERSLHLISDMDARDSFRDRSQIIRELRSYLHSADFMEVETPTIQPVYGGANAEPFETHINDRDEDAYLRISPELYLKRLVIGGYERIFEVSTNFRNESIDRTHNPEFSMVEIYQAYADYNDMMELTENMVEQIAVEVTGSPEVEFDGDQIDLSAPWRRLSMRDAIEEYVGINVREMSDESLQEWMATNQVELDSGYERGLAIAEIFEEFVEPELVQPVHITDHPQETTPLCMDHREEEGMIERFESFIAGMELTNAYTELRDPIQQREHFEAEQRRQEEGDDEAHPLDMDFVNALELGMPPTGGLGIGIDRLVMILTDQTSIRDVIFFPMMSDRNE